MNGIAAAPRSGTRTRKRTRKDKDKDKGMGRAIEKTGETGEKPMRLVFELSNLITPFLDSKSNLALYTASIWLAIMRNVWRLTPYELGTAIARDNWLEWFEFDNVGSKTSPLTIIQNIADHLIRLRLSGGHSMEALEQTNLPALTLLDVSGNKFGTTGAKIVAEAIKVTKCTPAIIF
jgi:hypothetical protein